MGVVRTEDHEQFAANFGGLREGASVGVFSEFSVVDAGAVEADGGADVRLKGGAKGEMSPDAEAHGAETSRRDFCMGGEPVEYGAATGVEVGDGSFGGVFEAAGSACVVEWDGGAGRLDAVIDLGSGGDETVAGQADAGAEHCAAELEDVGVAEDAGGIYRRRAERRRRFASGSA